MDRVREVSTDQPAAASTGTAEALLAECLEVPPDQRSNRLAELCVRHPEHAGTLRALYARLATNGLTGPIRVPAPGTTLGEFRLVRQLGGGGMGVVWLARQRSLGRDVALKFVRVEHLPFDRARDRFRREAQAIATLEHPGIVRVFAAGEVEGLPYIAMELVRGRTLAAVLGSLAHIPAARRRTRDVPQPLRGDGPLEGRAPWVAACLRIAATLAGAVEHAHERGILHRDLKPSNVMLADDGRVLLLDFGLARIDSAETLTGAGTPHGSFPYMSPEQVRGESEHIDGRTDVYGLGMTLYELLTGRLPHVEKTAERTRRRILEGSPPDPRRWNRQVPWEVAKVCRTAIAAERGDRYPTMRAFRDDLERALALRPVMASAPGPARRLVRWGQRRPAHALGAVLLPLVVSLAALAAAGTDPGPAAAAAAGREEFAADALDHADIARLEERFAEQPRSYGVGSTLSRLYRLRGRPADSLRIAEQLAAEFPRRDGVAILLARAQWANEDVGAAIATMERAVRRDPGDPVLWSHLGTMLLHAGRLRAAAHWARRTLARLPDTALAHYLYGRVLHERGDLEHALRHHRTAVRLNPRYSVALMQLGMVERDLGLLVDAAEDLERAIVYEPNRLAAYRQLGQTLLQLDEPARAAAVFELGLAIDAHDARCTAGLAAAREGIRAGDPESGGRR